MVTTSGQAGFFEGDGHALKQGTLTRVFRQEGPLATSGALFLAYVPVGSNLSSTSIDSEQGVKRRMCYEEAYNFPRWI